MLYTPPGSRRSEWDQPCVGFRVSRRNARSRGAIDHLLHLTGELLQRRTVEQSLQFAPQQSLPVSQPERLATLLHPGFEPRDELIDLGLPIWRRFARRSRADLESYLADSPSRGLTTGGGSFYLSFLLLALTKLCLKRLAKGRFLGSLGPRRTVALIRLKCLLQIDQIPVAATLERVGEAGSGRLEVSLRQLILPRPPFISVLLGYCDIGANGRPSRTPWSAGSAAAG